MITLITGAPGAGKTAVLVEWLRTLYADRPIYVHGLNGLKLEHIPVDGSKWHTELPDGAILVIDEVQQVWRPRGPGHAAPASVQALETHRHRGIDIFLTTQKPNLLDSNVRGLVGRHVHIRDTGWLGRYIYEWPECSDNIAWKTCVVKRRFTLPKKAFDLYTSAALHSSAAKTKSMMPVITGGLVILALILVYLVYRAVTRHTEPVPVNKVQPGSTVQPGTSAKTGATFAPGQSEVIEDKTGRKDWPVYSAGLHAEKPDPYHGRALQIEGQMTVAGKTLAYFGLLLDGRRVATVTLAQLVKMGYVYVDLGPCAAVLRYRDQERVLTCGERQEPSRPDTRLGVDPAAPVDAFRPVVPRPAA